MHRPINRRKDYLSRVAASTDSVSTIAVRTIANHSLVPTTGVTFYTTSDLRVHVPNPYTHLFLDHFLVIDLACGFCIVCMDVNNRKYLKPIRDILDSIYGHKDVCKLTNYYAPEIEINEDCIIKLTVQDFRRVDLKLDMGHNLFEDSTHDFVVNDDYDGELSMVQSAYAAANGFNSRSTLGKYYDSSSIWYDNTKRMSSPEKLKNNKETECDWKLNSSQLLTDVQLAIPTVELALIKRLHKGVVIEDYLDIEGHKLRMYMLENIPILEVITDGCKYATPMKSRISAEEDPFCTYLKVFLG